jgi:hydrogenase maturation protein HypF
MPTAEASHPSSPPVRARVRVTGIVQGVGFRPFVRGLAVSLGLAGFVGNDSDGVFAEVEGDDHAVDAFLSALRTQAPPLARVEAVRAERLPPTGAKGFAIVASRAGAQRRVAVSPDAATCDACLRELRDPGDRRHRYPFLNCTDCGPRFTIVRDVPYDRSRTTMAGFELCGDCAREYHDVSDRRFHAQPVCCPRCGPRLQLVDAAGATVAGDPVVGAATLLRAGHVVAVKGLGGYHLAALAASEAAVSALRSRKHREDKPFAVMVADLDAAGRLCHVDDAEARLLTSARRPIVLLRRRIAAALAPAVAPGNRFVGLLLPYTPVHHLLCAELDAPLVLTSGNVSDEPIAYRDDDALARLAGIADAFLTSDRPIHVRTDDSVARVFRGRPLLLRRSRGYAPQPLTLPVPTTRPVLACGAQLKNTFCVVKGRQAFVSHHIGDLENYETLRAFTEGVAHYRRLFDVAPELVAHDLHPEYLSTKYALDLDGVDLVAVQHHHAHIASCLADNGEVGPVIGVAFDGLGLGDDGTIWGGEFLVADLADYERVAHLRPVAMPGGAAAIREPWRMAAAYLDARYGDAVPDGLDVVRRNAERWRDVLAAARAGVNAPLTSSVGRLFDAVAAIVGVRDRVNYEGQAAVELEQRADRREAAAYRARLTSGAGLVVESDDFVGAAVDDLLAGTDTAVIAARFHNGLADAVVAVCETLRETHGLDVVALSGGVFQNLLLLERAVAGLEDAGFRVLVHAAVPPNDGGISLGQAAIAAARDRG